MAWLRVFPIHQGREIAYRLPDDPALVDQAITVARALNGVPEDMFDQMMALESEGKTIGDYLTTCCVNESLPVDPGYDPQVVEGAWWSS